MRPVDLLRKFEENPYAVDAFHSTFFAKVCEYVSGEKRSVLQETILDDCVKENYDWIYDEIYWDTYGIKDLCGVGGELGFHVNIDRVCCNHNLVYDTDTTADLCRITEMDCEELSKWIADLESDYKKQNRNDPVQRAVFEHLKGCCPALFPAMLNGGKAVEEWEDKMWEVLIFSLCDDEEEWYGTTSMTMLNIVSPALDKWISFLETHKSDSLVKKRDQRRSVAVLKDLFDHDNWSFALPFYSSFSHSEKECSKWAQSKYQVCLLQTFGQQEWQEDPFELFHSGLLSPKCLVKMLRVKELLENMERKYHFLSEKGEGNGEKNINPGAGFEALEDLERDQRNCA